MPYLFTNSSDESGGPPSARDVHEAKPRDDDWNKLKWKEEDMLLGTKSGGHVEVEDADEKSGCSSIHLQEEDVPVGLDE
ncbi:hypothetical protein SCP_1101720 [Sparassis crispa]|uniref:Uncharacterized protein n=1 Tax=Sparassis crispa TaxID=139825 RepID=A0A401GZA3_9APHY|nr:hypothetical protein SCP_1101720 [Sparassis crispa]GBE87495.1 hypothetical protein SCP_1101720 [Sparassis crispa]